MSDYRDKRCDGPNCGHIKGNDPNWWLIKELNGSLLLQPWTATIGDALDLCGAECVLFFIDNWMHEQIEKRKAS